MEDCALTSLEAFRIPSYSGCPSYNDYRYGLETIEWRPCYGSQLSRHRMGPFLYPRRDVEYFVGENDTLVYDLDTGCEAERQGGNRLTRALTYYAYVKYVLGGGHSLTVIRGVGHSMEWVFYNEAWVKAAYL
ncbi:hypothetical protein HK101_006571, partial [Irineochytrium annulatum]